MRAKRGNFAAQFVHSKSAPREKFDHFRKLFAHRREIPRHQMLPRMSLPAQEENRRSGPISHAKAPQGIGVPKGAIGLQNKGLNTRKRDLAREWLNAFGQKRGPFALIRPFALFHLFIAHSIKQTSVLRLYKRERAQPVRVVPFLSFFSLWLNLL